MVTDLFVWAREGDEIHRKEVTPLKKALVKRDQKIKDLEFKLKAADDTGKAATERAEFSKRLLVDLVLLANHVCQGLQTAEAVHAAMSKMSVGEDLMYTYGTWAVTSGRRAIQNEVRATLEASVDEDDLPKLLAVLPEYVPDTGPTPFSEVIEQASGPAVEACTEQATGPTQEQVTEQPKGGE